MKRRHPGNEENNMKGMNANKTTIGTEPVWKQMVQWQCERSAAEGEYVPCGRPATKSSNGGTKMATARAASCARNTP